MNNIFKKFLIVTLRTEFIIGIIAFILNIIKAIILSTNLFIMIALVIALCSAYILQWKLVNPHKSFMDKIFD